MTEAEKQDGKRGKKLEADLFQEKYFDAISAGARAAFSRAIDEARVDSFEMGKRDGAREAQQQLPASADERAATLNRAEKRLLRELDATLEGKRSSKRGWLGCAPDGYEEWQIADMLRGLESITNLREAQEEPKS